MLVSNLGYDVTDPAELEEMFGQVGEVLFAKVRVFTILVLD